jgi:uncharacterized membrane protein
MFSIEFPKAHYLMSKKILQNLLFIFSTFTVDHVNADESVKSIEQKKRELLAIESRLDKKMQAIEAKLKEIDIREAREKSIPIATVMTPAVKKNCLKTYLKQQPKKKKNHLIYLHHLVMVQKDLNLKPMTINLR